MISNNGISTFLRRFLFDIAKRHVVVVVVFAVDENPSTTYNCENNNERNKVENVEALDAVMVVEWKFNVIICVFFFVVVVIEWSVGFVVVTIIIDIFEVARKGEERTKIGGTAVKSR
jgi:hypothetical protein